MKWLLLLLMMSQAFASHQQYRKRISQMKVEYDEADVLAEIKFGRELAAKILGKYQLLSDQKLQQYVSTLGAGLAQMIGRPELDYHFAVIVDDDINAYAGPGGYIFITSGAIALMKNEAQLIGVLAHEIAHVNKRSVVKKLKIRGDDDSLAAGLGVLIGGATASYRKALESALDKAFDLLFEEGISMKEELLADYLALLTLQAQGLNWQSYIDYLANMDKAIAKGQGEVVQKTHPPTSERIDSLNRHVKSWDESPKEVNQTRFKKYGKVN